METPKWCCRMQPQVFTDVKVGRTERMWVVVCADCGKYADDPTRAGAIKSWDCGMWKRNPGNRGRV